MEKDSVLAHFAAAAVDALPAPARDRVLAGSGVPPELLEQPHARIPARAFATLWLAVARELDDEFFGLDRRRMKVGSFALLCHAVLGAGTLRRALEQMLRGFATFLDDVGARLDVAYSPPQAAIVVANRVAAPARRRFADETFLVMVHGLASWLVGRRVPLVRADFAWPRPAHAGEYAAMFCRTLRFDAEATAIVLDARSLELPLVQTAASLKLFLRDAPQSVFVKYRNAASASARVRQRLRACEGGTGWPTLDDVARDLRVAPTTLRRRLEAEGTTYRDVKDQLRLELAMGRLRESSAAVADIAFQLGFQDTSAFHRAFKRWCGMRPGEYRAMRDTMLEVASGPRLS
jgi:AraC-like DNA-binding protein